MATRRPGFPLYCTGAVCNLNLLSRHNRTNAPTSASPSGTPMPEPDGEAEEHVVADVLKITVVVIVTVAAVFVADESGPQLAMTLPGMIGEAPFSVEQPYKTSAQCRRNHLGHSTGHYRARRRG